MNLTVRVYEQALEGAFAVSGRPDLGRVTFSAFLDAVPTDHESLAHRALTDGDADPSLYLRLQMSKICALQPLGEQARPEYSPAEQVVDQRGRHALRERVQTAQCPA
jgi:hypothetical protein